MKSATMRGTGLGAINYESDRAVEAPATEIGRYIWAQGHQSVIPFSIEAEEIPVTWMCRCGREASVMNPGLKMSTAPTAEPRVQRSHWDMLMERRTIADLQELLNERLLVLRNQIAQEQLLSA